MKSVNVNTEELIPLVKKNRDGHKAIFDKAFEGYRLECIRVLEENLKLLRGGKMEVVRFHEVPPQDHTEEYNRVIAMLEMSTDAIVELSAQEFQQYVQDDWSWKRQWAAMNSKYTEAPER